MDCSKMKMSNLISKDQENPLQKEFKLTNKVNHLKINYDQIRVEFSIIKDSDKEKDGPSPIINRTVPETKEQN